MTDYIVAGADLTAVANKIRSKGGTSAQLEFPSEFISAIEAISGGGGSAVVQPLSVTRNGTYNPPNGVDGYAPVTVDVSGGSIANGTTAPTASQGSDGDIYVQKRLLPSDVTFVDYLQGDGNQYILTDHYAGYETGLYVEMTPSGNSFAVGARYNNNPSRAIAIMADTAARAFADRGATRKTLAIVSDEKVAIDIDRYTLKKNGETQSFYPLDNTFTTPVPMVLFGMNTNGTIVKATRYMKIHRVVVREAGHAIADYLPCLDGNGVACMWDNIAQEYVYNDGTGDFTYGSTITPEPSSDTLWVKQNGAWTVIGDADGVNTGA
jgi:hypothetical protein